MSTATEGASEPDDDPEPETTEPGDPDGETEEPNQRDSVTFASLSMGQQRIIGGICQAVEDARAGAFNWDDTWALSVYGGDAGVPAMGAAFGEVGEVQDPGKYLEGAGPVCEEIGWVPTG